MPNLTKRGFKKPLETEAYDININNFNTDKTEEELDKLLPKDGDGKDVKVTFTEAETDTELTSQSKLSTLFGLTKKKINVFSQTLEHKADKESPQFTGTPTINGNEIATVNNIPAGLSLGETSSTAYRGDRGKVAYDHSQSAHAPSTAQKNSDITRAEIEAKLTGQVSTHSHASDSTKAPTNHASPSDLYGLSTPDYYGHTRVWNGLDATSVSGAIALHANQGKVLNDKITNLELSNNIYGLPKIKTVSVNEVFTVVSDNPINKEFPILKSQDYKMYTRIIIALEGSFTHTRITTASSYVTSMAEIRCKNLYSGAFYEGLMNMHTAQKDVITFNGSIHSEYGKAYMRMNSGNPNTIKTYYVNTFTAGNGFTDDTDIILQISVSGDPNCAVLDCNFNINIYAK